MAGEKKEITLAPGQTLEDALKDRLRELEEELGGEVAERKKRGEEAADLRKRLRQAEAEKAEAEERRRLDAQKTLEEQGRFKDLYENERRGREQAKREAEEFEKKWMQERQDGESVRTKLQTYEQREAARIEARFQKLPEELRKMHAQSPTEVKEALADMHERLGGGRGSPAGGPAFTPPGLPPPGTVFSEEDLEGMTYKERQAFYKSGDFEKAVREGRFLSKGKGGPR